MPKMLPNGGAAFNYLYARYRSTAASRGYSFNLSKDEFRFFLIEPCFYCGIPRFKSRRKNVRNLFTTESTGKIIRKGIVYLIVSPVVGRAIGLKGF